MNTTIQCIILLACTAICTSVGIKRCLCVKTTIKVDPSRVTDVKEYDPRPYCNKREIIVTLNDNRQKCLDPNAKVTQRLLQQRKAASAEKMKTISPKTTTAAETLTTTAADTLTATAADTLTATVSDTLTATAVQTST